MCPTGCSSAGRSPCSSICGARTGPTPTLSGSPTARAGSRTGSSPTRWWRAWGRRRVTPWPWAQAAASAPTGSPPCCASCSRRFRGCGCSIGGSYRDHAAELGNTVPTKPLLFFKPPTAVIGDGAAIVLPPESRQVDFEGEIGVVIGRPLRRTTESEARAGIAGITCVNDVTARDLQRAEEQWTRAKGFDTFCPIGPRVVPVDRGRFDELEVFCRVNGKQRQHGRAPDMVFSILALVSFVSQVM